MTMRTTYDIIYIPNGKLIMNLNTKAEARNFLNLSVKTGFIPDASKCKIVSRRSKPFKLGDKWRVDFDYIGMLKVGLRAELSWGANKLEKLFYSFEEYNCHIDNLQNTIYFLKHGANKKAERELIRFKEVCDDLLEKEIRREKYFESE